MGRGGQGSQKPRISWSEIEQHKTKNDRWIVIGGEVYDVTAWSGKHPGGSRLIGHYAGQDATEAVGAFHNNETQVKKYLKTMHVGTVEDNEELNIAKDFRKLKEVAKSMIDKDPDARIDKLLVVGDVMPVEVAKSRKKSMSFNWQHMYFFALGPPLLFPVYFQFMLFRHFYTRKLFMFQFGCYYVTIASNWEIPHVTTDRCLQTTQDAVYFLY